MAAETRSQNALDTSRSWIYVLVMFYSTHQIWTAALARNRAALSVIVAQLWALLEVFGGADAVRLPRSVHSSVLRVLRPAESAVRRLIVIAARDVIAPVPKPPGLATVAKRGTSRQPPSRMSFKLIDPRKRFQVQRVIYTTQTPRISIIAPDAPFAPIFAQPPSLDRVPLPCSADRPISARRLCLRLKALTSALDDVPHQAKRLALWQFKRATEVPPKFSSPLRPGKPPGYRRRSDHEVDDILSECHSYAMGVLNEVRTNTS
jgi:hypothetical protein